MVLRILGDVEALFSDTLYLVFQFDGEGGDFGVLALGAECVRFATHFLQDEPEILALGTALGERVEEQLVVAAETSDFFVNIELVGHDAGFLQQAHFVDFGILHERIDAFTELRFPRFNALRIEYFDLVDDFVQVDHAAGEIHGEVGAFFFAHGDNAVQSLVEFGLQVLFPNFIVVVSVGELQNFWNRKHMFKLDIAGNAVFFLHGLRDFYELGDGCFVVANGDVSGVASPECD